MSYQLIKKDLSDDPFQTCQEVLCPRVQLGEFHSARGSHLTVAWTSEVLEQSVAAGEGRLVQAVAGP